MLASKSNRVYVQMLETTSKYQECIAWDDGAVSMNLVSWLGALWPKRIPLEEERDHKVIAAGGSNPASLTSSNPPQSNLWSLDHSKISASPEHTIKGMVILDVCSDR